MKAERLAAFGDIHALPGVSRRYPAEGTGLRQAIQVAAESGAKIALIYGGDELAKGRQDSRSGSTIRNQVPRASDRPCARLFPGHEAGEQGQRFRAAAAAMPCAGSSPTQACRRGRSAPLSTSRELPTNSPSSARWSGCRRRVRAERELAGAETRRAVSVHGDGCWRPSPRAGAQAGISLLSIATYETDYFLVNAGRFDQAVAVLAEAGHRKVR